MLIFNKQTKINESYLCASCREKMIIMMMRNVAEGADSTIPYIVSPLKH